MRLEISSLFTPLPIQHAKIWGNVDEVLPKVLAVPLLQHESWDGGPLGAQLECGDHRPYRRAGV